MTSGKRFTKKAIREDKLVTSAFRTSEYIQKNPTSFVIGGVSLAVILAAILFFRWNANKTETEATTLLARGRLALEAGQPETGLADLENLVNDYSGSEQARMGAMLLANNYYRNADYEKSLQYFEMAARDRGGDPMRLAAAESGAAICHEMVGNRAEAAKYFKMAADDFPDRNWAPDYMKQAINNYLAVGDTATAIKVIDELFAKYETSTAAQAAKRTLAEITY